ncbi:MAG TPA: pseudouridine synthase [Spirochaetia bacterium]|nr:pseudouridine synthase [Spirochaetia bacterium]
MKQFRIDDMLLYEDDDIIIINKPAGLASADERDTSRPSLLGLLRARNPGTRLCHRIDRETSGVIVAAKHFPVHRVLAEQFRRRQVRKIYHALVWGRAAFAGETIEHPLRTISSVYVPFHLDGEEVSPVSTFRAVLDTRRGRPSQTIVTTLSTSRHFSLVECRPVTGRMHQIRAHLSREGYPVVCDPLYRGAAAYLSELKRGYRHSGEGPERPLISRVALHACAISFELFDRKYTFEAPYPKDFAALLKTLAKYDGF